MDHNLLADEILIKLLKASDELAFKAIYDRYWKKLFLAAYYKVRSKEASEEIIQDIFTGLWEKRTNLSIEHLGHYLNAAVRYQVINYVQLLLFRQNKLAQIKGPDTDNSTEASIALHHLNAAIQQAMALLPEKTREVFTLSRFEEYTVKEIALRLNLSEKAVEYHITRSIKLMRIHLKEFIAIEVAFLFLK